MARSAAGSEQDPHDGSSPTPLRLARCAWSCRCRGADRPCRGSRALARRRYPGLRRRTVRARRFRLARPERQRPPGRLRGRRSRCHRHPARRRRAARRRRTGDQRRSRGVPVRRPRLRRVCGEVRHQQSRRRSLTGTKAGDDPTRDSDPAQRGSDTHVGWTDPVLLTEDDPSDLTIDAGILIEYEECSIGDFVWSDENANGIQDEGEPGIPNVVIAETVDQQW